MLGGNSMGFFWPKIQPQYQPENRPKVPFEKDTYVYINFELWTIQVAFWAIFTTVVPFLIQ